jgi:hypothetical protein
MELTNEIKQEELLRILSMPREQRPSVKRRFIKPIGSYKDEKLLSMEGNNHKTQSFSKPLY